MRRKAVKRRAMAVREPPKPPKKTVNIKIHRDTHEKLKALRIIPEEHLDTVIKRLIKFYEEHQQEAEKRPQQQKREGFLV